MRLLPFSRRAARAEAPLPAVIAARQEMVRPVMADVFAVSSQGARGPGLLFVGELLVPADRALALLESRLRPLGFLPFLSERDGRVWLDLLPATEPAAPGRLRLNVVLFFLTLISTVWAGYFVAGSVPFLTFDPSSEPRRLLDGLPFAVTLLGILGTHEFGHYFAARRHGAAVSLPYFIPAPPPIFLFGTLGALIRMRSPARDRNALLDIAVAGPLAGLVVALPSLWLGLAWSRVARVPAGGGTMEFGDSLLMRAMVHAVFGPLPPGTDVFVHPVALAGWVGLFVTALNLFPVGQLDGGRIAYALFRGYHRHVSIATVVALVVLGVVSASPNWFAFALLVVLLIGVHHAPPMDDITPLSPGRAALGLACLVLLVLLVPPVPLNVH
jgi:membrane-associated protease RseP (regulator of RpoE activity)